MGTTRCAVCVRTGRHCSDIARGRVLYFVTRLGEDLHLLVEELRSDERAYFFAHGSPEQRAEVEDIIAEEHGDVGPPDGVGGDGSGLGPTTVPGLMLFGLVEQADPFARRYRKEREGWARASARQRQMAGGSIL